MIVKGTRESAAADFGSEESKLVSKSLPLRLAEWQGAQEVAASIDERVFRKTVHDLVELVLPEDMSFIDSLSPDLESSLITPISILAEVKDSENLAEVVVAVRVVRHAVEMYRDQVPPELSALLDSLPG